jgi:hypothetical protein
MDLPISRRGVRVVAVIVAVVMLALPVSAFVVDIAESSQQQEAKRVESVEGTPPDGLTAITTQQFSATYPDAELVVVAPNGSTIHVNTQWDSYFDVDPVPGEPWLVEYVASEDISEPNCNGGEMCTRQVFVRENIRTGESTIIWSTITPRKHNTRVHDIDRINETHIAIADIYEDAVHIYDTERQIRVWTWEAQRDFPISGGGPFPEDWTHINDVEVLEDGTLMASLRNQDSVVFIARNGTLLESRTLGEDDRHEILYEQHNPDFIPGTPPSVLVADSEKSRIVEFERNGTGWTTSWVWRDSTLQWPRDADRLPSGNTLITDTQGGRVIEVDKNGSVVWTVRIGLPYEAERLSTGDESSGGPTATEAGLTSRGAGSAVPSSARADTGVIAATKGVVQTVVPPKILNGVLFALPQWAVWWHLPLALIALLDLAVWGYLEYRWSGWKLRMPFAKAG